MSLYANHNPPAHFRANNTGNVTFITYLSSPGFLQSQLNQRMADRLLNKSVIRQALLRCCV